jgi:hypothetical protein
MSEQPVAGRDVLAELDSIQAYLLGLCGDNPQPGLDANKKTLPAEFAAYRGLAQNTVELAAEYASGGTFKDRLEKTYGRALTEEQVAHLVPGADAAAYRTAQEQIADLQRQLAEARGGNV